MNSNLTNKAGFQKLYGDYSLDYPAVNGYGSIETNYTYFKYFGLALFIVGCVAMITYLMNKDKNKNKNKNSKKENSKTMLYIASGLLAVGGGMFIFYLYAYFYIYLPQFRNFFSDLPEEGANMLKTFN